MNTAALVHDISGSYDAFMRLRVSNPYSIFDCKLLYDKQPLFWDDAVLSGSGTSSVYNSNQASVTLNVSSNVPGLHARQTFQRFLYQPGKSQLIMMTGVIGAYVSGVTKRIGLFDNKNGLFFQSGPDGYYVGKRTYVTGSTVDTLVPQSEWNKNKLDSQDLINLDFNKANIFYFNYEWLGVGDIFCGVALGAKFVPLHQFYNANNVSTVTFSLPNLPLRYEIQNNGTGPASSLTCICTTVMSEGGQQGSGYIYSIDRNTNVLSINASGIQVPLISIRLQTGKESACVFLEGINVISTTTNVIFRWVVLLNPTFLSPITYTQRPYSCIEYNNSTTVTTTVTGGVILFSGYGVGKDANIFTNDLAAKLSLGVSLGGVSDVLVLAIQRLDNQTDSFYGSVTVREAV